MIDTYLIQHRHTKKLLIQTIRSQKYHITLNLLVGGGRSHSHLAALNPISSLVHLNLSFLDVMFHPQFSIDTKETMLVLTIYSCNKARRRLYVIIEIVITLQ